MLYIFTIPTKNSEPVFQLIKSLKRTEKRHFRLFTNRPSVSKSLKFLLLFDPLNALDTAADAAVLAQVPSLKRAHLANLYQPAGVPCRPKP